MFQKIALISTNETVASYQICDSCFIDNIIIPNKIGLVGDTLEAVAIIKSYEKNNRYVPFNLALYYYSCGEEDGLKFMTEDKILIDEYFPDCAIYYKLVEHYFDDIFFTLKSMNQGNLNN